VPARNEAGHLDQLINIILSVDEINHVVIVEGGSTDETFKIAENLASCNPKRITCIRQSGKGKLNALLEGAAIGRYDFTMIWDADGTVPLESTKLIINRALIENCMYIGDRLRGEIEPGAMQFANKIGNWLFAVVWAPINKLKPTDIFCGTKVAPSAIFLSVPKDFIDRDPYGDISLLFSARKLKIKIKAIPVQYQVRVYGESKMRRWKMGVIFFELTIRAYLKIIIRK
jgi:glycosyltransferase involved in cell wall biosynthesis